MIWSPNQSPEPTAVGAVSSAIAGHVIDPAWLSSVVRHHLNIVRLKAILATTLAIVLAHVATAGVTPDDPKFEKFKREMLPQVGRKVTVVGKLDSGKLGWWLSSQEWGLYLYTTTTNRADLEKMNGLGKFRGHKVKVVGTLRHREYRASGNPLVSSIPEHFFFDVAEIVVSDDETRPDDKAKTK